jgi:hypothetical protein
MQGYVAGGSKVGEVLQIFCRLADVINRGSGSGLIQSAKAFPAWESKIPSWDAQAKGAALAAPFPFSLLRTIQ